MNSKLHRPQCRCRKGLFLVDVIIALSLVALMALLLANAARWHRKAAAALDVSQQATRAVESAMTRLVAGEAAADLDASIDVRRLVDPAPPGYTWVRVTVPTSPGSPPLVGLAPATALGGVPLETGRGDPRRRPAKQEARP